MKCGFVNEMNIRAYFSSLGTLIQTTSTPQTMKQGIEMQNAQVESEIVILYTNLYW